MSDNKVSIFVYSINLYFPVVLRQNLRLMLEELNELLRHDVGHFHFADIERSSVPLPHHVVHKIAIFVGRHDRDLSLTR